MSASPRPLATVWRLVLTLALALPAAPALAFHFPWDQGHDTFHPDIPPPPCDTVCDTCNNTASPFVAGSGAYRLAETDVLIPGTVPLMISRTYHSNDLHPGMFGRGWIFSYGYRLVEVSDGDEIAVILRRPNGQRDRFVQNTDGSYLTPTSVYETLSKQPDGTFVLTTKEGTTYHFDDVGALERIADRRGNVLSMAYDAAGFLTDIADDQGRSLHLTKGADGKIATVTDPAGRTVSYQYDGSNNLATTTDPAGGITRYGYDSKGRLTSITRPRGNLVTAIGYDTLDRVVSYTDQGNTYRVTYSSASHLATIRDDTGRQRTVTYNDHMNVTSRSDFLGNTETFTYDGNFNATAVTDGNGHTTSYTFDSRGNAITATDPLGNTTLIDYEATFNRPVLIVNPSTASTEVGYDAEGNVVRVVDAAGNESQMAYDDEGHMIGITDAAGGVSNLSYDAFGNRTQITDPLGNTTHFTYDAIGNLIAEVDALGRTKSFEYDPNNRVTIITDPLNGVTSFDYDANGNVVAITDPKGLISQFEYDSYDRLVKIINPLNQERTFQYDNRGNVLVQTDPNGVGISFVYDADDRLIRKNLPGDVVSYSYDAVGNLLSISDSDTGLQLQYDAANRLSRAETLSGVAQPATVVTYAYDADGRRTRLTDPQGGAYNYEYDPMGRLLRLTEPSGVVAAFSYDALGRRVQAQFGNGTTMQSTFDAGSRAIQVVNDLAAGAQLPFTYVYDADGNRIQATDIDGLNSYQYDALERLLAATHPASGNPPESYSYDAASNRTSSHLSATTIYDAANRLVEDDGFTYLYDANGNLTRKTSKGSGATTLYSYDAEDQLVRIDFPDGTYAAYRYDGMGRRVEKDANGVLTRYIYDRTNVLWELDGGNSVVAAYTHGPGIDDLIAMTRGGQRYAYHRDGLGSIVALSDGSGTVAGDYTYDSFGRMIASSGVLNPYTFTRREYDAESDLYYFRARYYDPQIGRFLQEDPIRDVNGENLYSYADNNPVNLVDPLGLQHRPGGPWHPPSGVATGCSPLDSCSVLSNKIRLLKKMIDSHINWDKQNCPGRHDTEIQDLENALANCIAIHQRKCVTWKPRPIEVPEVDPVVIPILVVGTVVLVCILCPECCFVVAPGLAF
jgi:RHS repeat-associated protein